MLKKLVASSLLLAASSLFALTEGKEYFALGQNERLPAAEGTVVELLSYGCIHCYNQFKAGTMEFLADLLPEMKFEEWQVCEMGQYGEQMTKILAFAAALDRADGLNPTLNEKSRTHRILGSYFDATFKFRLRWKSEAEFYAIALAVLNEGRADGEKFSQASIEAFAEGEGKAALTRMHSAINVAKTSGTPAFIVNGKYLVNIEAVGSQEDLASIVKELVELK